MKAIYSVNSYSYFRNDLNDNNVHKCINPLHVLYSRPQNKWGKVMILVMDQAKVTLLPAAQDALGKMTSHHDQQALDRWQSVLDKDQIQKLMDRYHNVAPEVERPPSEAASSSYRAQTREREMIEKEKEKERPMVIPVDGHGSKPTTMLVTGSQQLYEHEQPWCNVP